MVKWGLIGTGNIASKFATGLTFTSEGVLYAVASRTQEKADVFAQKHGAKVAYGCYEDIVKDENVDVIYISTPNNLHYSNTLMCLNAGKPVLCEKPFALNSEELNEMVELATKKNVFMMEALWTRFLPSIAKLDELLQSGAIGKPLMLQADFGFKANYSPTNRLFSPQLGGGSVLDIGLYPIFLSLMLFGEPVVISSLSVPAPTGTDMTTTMLFKHRDEQLSQLTCSFAMSLKTEAVITGTEGSITLHRMFHMPTTMSITKNNVTEAIPVEYVGNGYNYEAEEVMRCLKEGKKESDLLPLSFSLLLMDVLDQVLS